MIIYKIFYKERKIYDIKLIVRYDENIDLYWSDIHCDVIPEGIAYYIFEKVKNVEDLEYAIQRCNDINDLRTVLYESLDWNNKPLPEKEAMERHNKVFRPFFEKVMKDYCEEFGLGMVTD